MRAHLTELSLRAVKSQGKQIKIWDRTTPGFGVRIWVNPHDDERLASWVEKSAKSSSIICVGFFPLRTSADWYRNFIASNPAAQIRLVDRKAAGELTHGTDQPRRVFVVFRGVMSDAHAQRL